MLLEARCAIQVCHAGNLEAKSTAQRTLVSDKDVGEAVPVQAYKLSDKLKKNRALSRVRNERPLGGRMGIQNSEGINQSTSSLSQARRTASCVRNSQTPSTPRLTFPHVEEYEARRRHLIY